MNTDKEIDCLLSAAREAGVDPEYAASCIESIAPGITERYRGSSSAISEMPPEIITQMARSLDIASLMDLCKTNKGFQKYCNDSYVLTQTTDFKSGRVVADIAYAFLFQYCKPDPSTIDLQKMATISALFELPRYVARVKEAVMSYVPDAVISVSNPILPKIPFLGDFSISIDFNIEANESKFEYTFYESIDVHFDYNWEGPESGEYENEVQIEDGDESTVTIKLYKQEAIEGDVPVTTVALRRHDFEDKYDIVWDNAWGTPSDNDPYEWKFNGNFVGFILTDVGVEGVIHPIERNKKIVLPESYTMTFNEFIDHCWPFPEDGDIREIRSFYFFDMVVAPFWFDYENGEFIGFSKSWSSMQRNYDDEKRPALGFVDENGSKLMSKRIMITGENDPLSVNSIITPEHYDDLTAMWVGPWRQLALLSMMLELLENINSWWYRKMMEKIS